VRRKLQFAFVAALALGLVLAVAIALWVNMGGLDRWFANTARAKLLEMNVRAEMGKTELGLRAGVVTIDDVKLYAGDQPEPFFTTAKLTAHFDYTLLWQRRIDLKELTLEQPHVVVHFDANGGTNLDAIKLPEDRGETDRQFTDRKSTRLNSSH